MTSPLIDPERLVNLIMVPFERQMQVEMRNMDRIFQRSMRDFDQGMLQLANAMHHMDLEMQEPYFVNRGTHRYHHRHRPRSVNREREPNSYRRHRQRQRRHSEGMSHDPQHYSSSAQCVSPPSDDESKEICSICQDSFSEKDTIKQLICGHLFHRRCVNQWLHHSATCPTCRQEV